MRIVNTILLMLLLPIALPSCTRDTKNVGSALNIQIRVTATVEAIGDADLQNLQGGDVIRLGVVVLSNAWVPDYKVIWNLDGAAADPLEAAFNTSSHYLEVILAEVEEETTFTFMATVSEGSGITQSDSVTIQVYPEGQE